MSGICMETTKILYYGYNKDTGQMIKSKVQCQLCKKRGMLKFMCKEGEG